MWTHSQKTRGTRLTRSFRVTSSKTRRSTRCVGSSRKPEHHSSRRAEAHRPHRARMAADAKAHERLAAPMSRCVTRAMSQLAGRTTPSEGPTLEQDTWCMTFERNSWLAVDNRDSRHTHALTVQSLRTEAPAAGETVPTLVGASAHKLAESMVVSLQREAMQQPEHMEQHEKQILDERISKRRGAQRDEASSRPTRPRTERVAAMERGFTPSRCAKACRVSVQLQV